MVGLGVLVGPRIFVGLEVLVRPGVFVRPGVCGGLAQGGYGLFPEGEQHLPISFLAGLGQVGSQGQEGVTQLVVYLHFGI